MKQITIGNVRMPTAEFAIARTAVLGIPKSGKTYGAKSIVEQLLDQDVPVIILDCVGKWRYLRNADPNNPNGKGYKVVVAGGMSPDLPLTPTGAPAIVRAAMNEDISLVFDLFDPKLRKKDWGVIVQGVCDTLFFENKRPRMLIIE